MGKKIIGFENDLIGKKPLGKLIENSDGSVKLVREYPTGIPEGASRGIFLPSSLDDELRILEREGKLGGERKA